MWAVRWPDCDLYIGGVVNGRFDPAAQSFLPNTGVAGLPIASTPSPPTGSSCATFDFQARDAVALSGSFVDTPPAGSTRLTIANP